MNTRILTLLLLSALFLALSPAPGAAQPGYDSPGVTPDESDLTTITLWTSEMPEDRRAVSNYLMDVLEVLGGSVRVEVISVEENKFVERLEEVIGTDGAPHLINTGSELIGAIGEKGYLDTAMAKAFIEKLGRNRFYSGPLAQLSMPEGAGHYGIPYHGWVQGIWYRADWFEEAGLQPPTTWETLLKAAQHFTDPSKGTYGILVGTDTDQYAEQIFTQIALSNNALMFNRDGTLRFNTPAMVESLKFYLELARQTPPGPQTWRARDYYMQGRMAMFFYSTFIMDDLALEGVAANSLTGENFEELKGSTFNPDLARNTRLAPLVVKRVPSSYGMINGFAVVKGLSEAQQQAVRTLLDFLYQPTNYVEWLHMAPGGMLPVVRDIADSEIFMRDPLSIFKRYGRPKILEIIGGLEGIRNFGLVEGHRFPQASLFYAEGIIPKMIHKALNEGLAPRHAVAWAEEEMRARMEENSY